ncbi:MAG: hypothetical protein Q8R83_00445 [Legionellaceae bacterium]|nr:hypothetical protein [Legionellaceae bacterium]
MNAPIILNNRNSIGEDEWLQILEAIRHNRVLKQLIVTHSGIGTLGAEQLAAILSDNHSLEMIDLRGNNIATAGIVAVTEAMLRNTHINELYLMGNNNLDGLDNQQSDREMTERAGAMIKLITHMHRYLRLDFPAIWNGEYNVLATLVNSMENNPFILYSNFNTPNTITESFSRYPKLRQRAMEIKERNNLISFPLHLLKGRDFTKHDIHHFFPELPNPFPDNTNIMVAVFDARMAKMQTQTPNIAENINKNDILHNVYRLLNAEKCAALGRPREAMALLNQPFCHPGLQLIADNLLPPLLVNYEIFNKLTEKEKVESLWFRAYQARSSNDNAALEVAKDALEEMNVIPEDTDEDTFAAKLISLEAHMGDYRNRLLTKMARLNLPEGNWYNPLSFFASFFSPGSQQSASDSLHTKSTFPRK